MSKQRMGFLNDGRLVKPSATTPDRPFDDKHRLRNLPVFLLEKQRRDCE